MKTLTPLSTMDAGSQVMVWCRLHRIDAERCIRVLIFPRLRLAAFAMNDIDSRGCFFLRDGDVAWHWTLRILRIPPPDAWTVEGSGGE